MHEFQESAIVNNWYTWSEWITADELMRFRFSENVYFWTVGKLGIVESVYGCLDMEPIRKKTETLIMMRHK